jgi:heme/copper-type cytochrome/quinol oxidase subunit 3
VNAARPPVELDVSGLPPYAFGVRAGPWLGAALLIAIEGTMTALMVVSYFYLRGNYAGWPPNAIDPRARTCALIEAVILGASLVPNWLANRSALREDLAAARSWMIVTTLLGVAALALRWFELRHIGFRWDSHAYGSVFWMTLGIHCTHLVGGVVENGILIALLARGPVEKKTATDVQTSGLLWYFVALEWLALVPILYLEPLLRTRP